MLEIRIDNISSRTGKKSAQAGLVNAVMRELESGLKKRSVNPTDFRVRALTKESALLVRGNIDKYTVGSVMDSINKRKSNWSWDEPVYVKVETPQIDTDSTTEKLSELYVKIEESKQMNEGLKQALQQEKQTSGKYQSQATSRLSQIESLQGVLTKTKEEKEFHETEVFQLKTKVKEKRGELQKLREAFSRLGEVPDSAVEHYLAAIKSNIEDIREQLDSDVQFFLNRNVFDQLEELKDIHGKSLEEYLAKPLEDSGVTLLEDQSINEFLDSSRVKWENSEAYKERIDAYTRAKEENEFVRKYKAGDFGDSIPESVINSIGVEKNEEIITNFELEEEEHKKSHAAIDSIEKAVLFYQLYEAVQERSQNILERGLVIKYLIGFEKSEEGESVIRVISPGDDSDKYIGKIIRAPLEVLCSEYETEIQYSSGISEVAIKVEDPEDNKKTDRLLHQIEEKVRSVKTDLEFFGFRANIAIVCEYPLSQE